MLVGPVLIRKLEQDTKTLGIHSFSLPVNMSKQLDVSKKKRRSVSFALAPLRPPPGFAALQDTVIPSQFSLDGVPPNYLSPTPRFSAWNYRSTPKTPNHAFWMPDTPQLPTVKVASSEQQPQQAEGLNSCTTELKSNGVPLLSQNDAHEKINIGLEKETNEMKKTAYNLKSDDAIKTTALNSKVQSSETSQRVTECKIEALLLEREQMTQKLAKLAAENVDLLHNSNEKVATLEQKIAVSEEEKLTSLKRIEEHKRSQLNEKQHMTEQIADLEFDNRQFEININILTRANDDLEAQKVTLSKQVQELTSKNNYQLEKIAALEEEIANLVSRAEEQRAASTGWQQSILGLKSKNAELTDKVNNLQVANSDQQRLINALDREKTELTRKVEQNENKHNERNQVLLAWKAEKKDFMNVVYEQYQDINSKCSEIRGLKRRIKQLELELAGDDGSNNNVIGREVRFCS